MAFEKGDGGFEPRESLLGRGVFSGTLEAIAIKINKWYFELITSVSLIMLAHTAMVVRSIAGAKLSRVNLYWETGNDDVVRAAVRHPTPVM